MSNSWDTSVDAVVNELTRPLSPLSPERAAKAQRLGESIGVPAPIIDLDPEHWQQRIIDQKNSDVIRRTPELQGYIAKDPINGKVSRDDMEALAQAAEIARAGRIGFNTRVQDTLPTIVPAPTKLFNALVEGFGTGPYGIDPTGQTEKDLEEMGLFGPGPGQQGVEALVRPVAGLGDIFLRLGMAGIHGVAELGKQGAEIVNLAAGQEVMDTESFGRAIGGVAESEFARQGAEVGATPHTPAREAVKVITNRIRSDIAKKMVPSEEGVPPRPLTPVEVDAIGRQAVFNALVDSTEETATKSRSPSSMYDFTETAVKDNVVAVPVEKVEKLYAESGVSPAPGDGVLGFTPDIVEQIERAKQTGSDVRLPMAGYLAHVKQEVHKALQDNLRVGEGPTVNEAAALVKETEQLKEIKEEITTTSAAKNEAIKVYHGTTSDYIQAIKEEGLRPGAMPGADAVLGGESFQKGRPISVFVTKQPETAKSIAAYAVVGAKKGEPVVLELSVPATEFENFVPDEKTTVEGGKAVTSFRTEQTIPSEWITGVVDAEGRTTPLREEKTISLLDEAELAKAVQENVERERLAPAGTLGEDIATAPRASAIQGEITEADFASRFSLNKGSDQTYAIMKDNRQIGKFQAEVDPGDPTTIRVSNVGIENAIDRPGVGDIRKLLRELQKDFPGVTHVQGERLGGSQMGARAPRTKIPKPEELVRRTLYLEPLFQDAKAAGMTEREFKLYSNNLRDYQKMVAEKKRATAERAAKKEFREKSEAERAVAAKDFDARRDIQAESLLRDSGVKFNEKLVDKDTVPRGLTTTEAKGGIAPDDIAGTLGYNTGAELLRDLEGLHQDRAGRPPAEYRRDVIEGRVEENVEPMPDFTDEVFSEPISKVLHDDLRVMQRQNEGKEGMPPLGLEELKGRAKRLFDEMSVKEATNLREYEKLVRENGRKAELALLSGDVPKAFKYKQQQLLAHLMAREAIAFSREFARPLGPALRAEARRAGEVGRAAVAEAVLPPEPTEPKSALPRWTSPTVLLERYQKRRPPDHVAKEYVDQIHGILQQHGVPLKRDAMDLEQALHGKDLRDFVNEKNAQGRNIQIADFVFNSRTARKLSDMTVENHRDLFRSIRSLDHVGKEEMMAQKGATRLALETLENEIVNNLNALPMVYDPSKRPLVNASKHLYYQSDALLVRPEQIFMDMDHRDPFGPITLSVNKLIQDSKTWENDLHKWAADEFHKFPRIERAEELIPNVPFRDSLTSSDGIQPGQPFKMKRLDAIMTAVQMGNDSSAEMVVSTLMGRDRYLADPIGSTRFVREWLERILTPNDWKFAEAVWALYNKIKPLEDYVYERTSGVTPVAVQPTPWNGHSGGYFPIIHDTIGGDIASKRANSPYDSHYRPTAVSTKHAKERTGAFMPVKIVDLYDLAPGDIRARLHDVAFKESINNAHKILSRPKIIEAMNKHYGKEYTDQLGYWLQEIANHYNQDDAMLGAWASLMRRVRQNLIVSTIAANVNVILSPNLGPAIKHLLFHPVDLARKIYNPRLARFIIENSGEIRHRMENVDRDLREVFTAAVGTRSNLQWLRSQAARFGMYLAVRMDTKLAMLAWDREYTMAMETGQTSFYKGEPKRFTHEEAVDAADKLVRLYFGSHSPVDLPGIMRTGETSKTLLSMFYGFQNTMYGRTRDVIQLSKSGARRIKEGNLKGARGDFASALAQSWMFIGLTAAFGYLYSPRAIDEHIKKGEYGTAAAILLGSQLLAIVPVLRDVGAAMLGYPARPSPVAQALINAEKLGEDIFYKDTGEPSTIKDLAGMMGLALGIPGANQIGKSVQYIWNATHGHDSDRYFNDWLRGIIYGKAKK